MVKETIQFFISRRVHNKKRPRRSGAFVIILVARLLSWRGLVASGAFSGLLSKRDIDFRLLLSREFLEVVLLITNMEDRLAIGSAKISLLYCACLEDEHVIVAACLYRYIIVGKGIAILIHDDDVGRSIGPCVQKHLVSLDRYIGDAGIADDYRARGPVHIQDARVVGINSKGLTGFGYSCGGKQAERSENRSGTQLQNMNHESIDSKWGRPGGRRLT